MDETSKNLPGDDSDIKGLLKGVTVSRLACVVVWVEYTYGTPMSVLPSFAERKRVWVFRRCTLSCGFYGVRAVNFQK